MRTVYLILCILLSGTTIRAQSLYFPPLTGNNWDTIAPQRLGWCQERIDSLYNYLDTTGTDGFIILKDGKIVLEKYFGTFTQDSLHYWASAGKSLTAMMTGIAQEKGLLRITDTVSKHLGTGWTSEPADKEKLITIKHLLTMTSGMDDTPPLPCDNLDDNKACLLYQTDAGTRWAYHTGPYRKLEDIITVVTGKTYTAATNDFIGDKIGMKGLWIQSVFYSKTRDMARFGLLTLSKGKWQNTSVLTDTAYFRAMTNSTQEFNPAYGYLWWLNGKSSIMYPGIPIAFPTALIPNAPADMFCALGKNDQKIYVIPSQNMVVVRTGESAFGRFAVSPYDDQLWDYINKLGEGCLASSAPSPVRSTSFRLFPNPANSFISFNGFAQASDKHFRIADLSGNILFEGDTYNNSIDVSNLSSGMYFLHVSAGDTYGVQQFFKN